MVAAPGCLSEIAWASGVQASRLAVAAAGGGGHAKTAAGDPAGLSPTAIPRALNR
jgi:hypothetical protein